MNPNLTKCTTLDRIPALKDRSPISPGDTFKVGNQEIGALPESPPGTFHLSQSGLGIVVDRQGNHFLIQHQGTDLASELRKGNYVENRDYKFPFEQLTITTNTGELQFNLSPSNPLANLAAATLGAPKVDALDKEASARLLAVASNERAPTTGGAAFLIYEKQAQAYLAEVATGVRNKEASPPGGVEAGLRVAADFLANAQSKVQALYALAQTLSLDGVEGAWIKGITPLLVENDYSQRALATILEPRLEGRNRLAAIGAAMSSLTEPGEQFTTVVTSILTQPTKDASATNEILRSIGARRAPLACVFAKDRPSRIRKIGHPLNWCLVL